MLPAISLHGGHRKIGLNDQPQVRAIVHELGPAQSVAASQHQVLADASLLVRHVRDVDLPELGRHHLVDIDPTAIGLKHFLFTRQPSQQPRLNGRVVHDVKLLALGRPDVPTHALADDVDRLFVKHRQHVRIFPVDQAEHLVPLPVLQVAPNEIVRLDQPAGVPRRVGAVVKKAALDDVVIRIGAKQHGGELLRAGLAGLNPQLQQPARGWVQLLIFQDHPHSLSTQVLKAQAA